MFAVDRAQIRSANSLQDSLLALIENHGGQDARPERTGVDRNSVSCENWLAADNGMAMNHTTRKRPLVIKKPFANPRKVFGRLILDRDPRPYSGMDKKVSPVVVHQRQAREKLGMAEQRLVSCCKVSGTAVALKSVLEQIPSPIWDTLACRDASHEQVIMVAKETDKRVRRTLGAGQQALYDAV